MILLRAAAVAVGVFAAANIEATLDAAAWVAAVWAVLLGWGA